MNTKTLLIASVLATLALTGCNRAPDESKATEPSAGKIIRERQELPADTPRPDAPTTRELLKYYSANLEEARTEWRRCYDKGIKNLTDEERPRCVAAQNAWHNQPYKPKSRE
jgi:hypothetical protein